MNSESPPPLTSCSPERAEGPETLFSIRAAANAAGISPQAIRMWEERYGRPKAVRLPSGHRRYTEAQLTWLRRVASALTLGHRPSEVIRLSPTELDALLDEELQATPLTDAGKQALEWIAAFRASDLRQWLRAEAHANDVVTFLSQRVAPLLQAVGRSWAEGNIQVRHEHAFTEVLQDELRRLRLNHVPTSRAAPIVLATLPGELHALGVYMIDLITASEGLHTHTLGADTPLDDIVDTVRDVGAHAVAISVSSNMSGTVVDRQLKQLRAQLPKEIALLVGGAGVERARRRPRGVEMPSGLRGWQAWVRAYRTPRSNSSPSN